MNKRPILERVGSPGRNLVWYRFSGLDRSFRHAMLTRRGGVSRGAFQALNLGHTVGDDPDAVTENHDRVFAALNIQERQVVSPHQVHRRRVARVEASDGGRIIPETDALITNAPGVPLMLRFADCVPVLLYDAVHRAVGLAHAGWRGVAAGVVPATVREMGRAFGTRPNDLWSGIGPAIGPDHYEVGREVAEAVQAATPSSLSVAEWRDGGWYLNLPGAVAAQLNGVGVSTVMPSGICTACHTDAWYSHRAEGGRTGRFAVVAWIAERRS